MATIIDRRNEGKGESLPNRQRLIRRYNKKIKKAIRDKVRDITTKDLGSDTIEVTVDDSVITEPSFNHKDGTGNKNYISNGNKKFNRGDTIPKPKGGAAGGKKGGDGEDSEDSFKFTVTKEEFMELFFEDLELPNLVKKELQSDKVSRWAKKGYQKNGNISLLNVGQTMINSLGRGMAEEDNLKKKLKTAKTKLEKDALKKKIKDIPFIEDLDLRYDHLEPVPDMESRAVMFCMLDVSGSMDERCKDLAKRFFLLLYLFLTKKYDTVELRFITHTTTAEEVTEEKFFYDTRMGGTQMSSGLAEIKKIIHDDYEISRWNMYIVQLTDGDNFQNDDSDYFSLLNELLDIVQQYYYVEVAPDQTLHLAFSDIWMQIGKLEKEISNLTRARLKKVEDIYPIFKGLFESKGSTNG